MRKDGIGDTFGIAFAGAGMVAELHMRALDALPQARLVGLFDPDRELAARRAESWSCRDYESLDALLADPAADGVFVLAPFEAHESVAVAALRADKHVLVEKPVASLSGIRRLLAEARERGLVCMPGHNYAYQPEFRRLRQLAREQAFGAPRAGWITYVIRHPEEIAARYAGVLEEVMIHHTYLALGLFGKPQRVYAGRARPGWESLDQEDQAWMTWEYASGLSVHLFASFAVDDETADPWLFIVKILGTRGGGTYNWRSVIYDRPLGTLSRAIPAYEDSYVDEDAAFVTATHGELAAIVSPLDDALWAAEILEAAARASAERRCVDVGRPDSPG